MQLQTLSYKFALQDCVLSLLNKRTINYEVQNSLFHVAGTLCKSKNYAMEYLW